MSGVRVLVGTRKGAFVLSSDGKRQRWDVSGPYFGGWEIYHVKGSPVDPNRLYASQYSGWFGQVIQRSDDGGKTWHPPGSPSSKSTAMPEALAQGQSTLVSEILEAARQKACGAETARAESNRFVYDTSPAAGKPPTTHQSADGTPRAWGFKCVWHLEPSLGDPDVVYAGIEDAALFRSTNGGQTWQEMPALRQQQGSHWIPGNGGLCLHSILLDPHNPKRIFVAISAAGAFRTDDDGQTWKPINRGLRSNFLPDPAAEIGHCVHHIARHPSRPNVLFMQKHWDVMRTDDAGESWQRISGNLPTDFGFPIEVHAHEPETIYVVPITSDSMHYPPEGKLRVYRSRTGGNDWEPLTKGLPQENCYVNVLRDAMAVDSLDGCGVYFGTTAGQVYLSADAGDNWAPIARDLPSVLSVEVQTLPQSELVADVVTRSHVMPKSIKVAVVTQEKGAHLADYFASLAKIEEAESVALADPSGQSEAMARKALGDKLKSVHKDPAEMLKRFEPHLAVVSLEAVAAPPMIDACLEAGAHVFAEKPSCTRAEDFEKLTKKAQEKHRLLMLAVANRSHAPVREARRLIRDGKLGKVYGVEVHLVTDETRLKSEEYRKSWFCIKARAGGGNLAWVGIHWLDLALFITGLKIKQVAGFAGNVGGQPIDIEDSAALALSFDNDSFGTMTAGYYLDKGYQSHVQVWGEHGWLRLAAVEEQPLEWYSSKDAKDAKVQKYEYPKGERGYLPFLRSCVRAAAGLEEPPVTAEEGLHVLRGIYAFYEAAKTGRVQVVK